MRAKTYSIPVEFIFRGTFRIKADSQQKAKSLVRDNCGLVLGGTIHSSLPEEEIRWDFPVHPKKIVDRRKRRSAK